MKRLIIWGCGKLGIEAGQYWAGRVIGFTHSTSRHDELRAVGIVPAVGNPANWLKPDDVLLLALPGHAKQHEAIKQLTNCPVPQRAVVISSTGYYGHPVHGVVSAERPFPTDQPRAQAIAKMEQDFMAWAGDNGCIIRFGGLYTNGAGLRWAKRVSGQPYERDADTTVPLIHYVDAGQATYQALARSEVRPAYVGMVNPSPTRRAFYSQACDALNIPLPIFSPVSEQAPATYDVTPFRTELLPKPMYVDWQTAVTPV